MVDLCIIYDDLQSTKNDWRNRTNIKHTKGEEWLTQPYETRGETSTCEVDLTDKEFLQVIAGVYQHCKNLRSFIMMQA